MKSFIEKMFGVCFHEFEPTITIPSYGLAYYKCKKCGKVILIPQK